MKKLQPQSVTQESGRQAIASEGVAAKMNEESARKDADAPLARCLDEATSRAVEAGVDVIRAEGRATVAFGARVCQALALALVGVHGVRERKAVKAELYSRIRERIGEQASTPEVRCPDPNRSAAIYVAYSRAAQHIGEPAANLMSVSTLKALARFVLWDPETGEYRLAPSTADRFGQVVEQLAKMYRKGGRPGWRAVRAIVDAALGHVRTGPREAEQEESRQEESRQEESRQEESRQEASAGHLPVRIADPVEAARVAFDALNNCGDPEAAWEAVGRGVGSAQIWRMVQGIFRAGNKTAYRALADAIRKRADQKATAAAVA